MQLIEDLERLSVLLIQGAIGEANSLWNSSLPFVAQHIKSLPPLKQTQLLPSLRSILQAQENKDWVAMSDSIRFELLVQLKS